MPCRSRRRVCADYFAALFPHFGARYAEDHKLPLLKVVGIYSEIDLLIVVFVIVCAVRAFLMFRGKLEPSGNWDALALGGILYLGGYVPWEWRVLTTSLPST